MGECYVSRLQQPLSPPGGKKCPWVRVSALQVKLERAVSNLLPGIQAGRGVFVIIELAFPLKPIFGAVHLQAGPTPIPTTSPFLAQLGQIQVSSPNPNEASCEILRGPLM